MPARSERGFFKTTARGEGERHENQRHNSQENQHWDIADRNHSGTRILAGSERKNKTTDYSAEQEYQTEHSQDRFEHRVFSRKTCKRVFITRPSVTKQMLLGEVLYEWRTHSYPASKASEFRCGA